MGKKSIRVLVVPPLGVPPVEASWEPESWPPRGPLDVLFITPDLERDQMCGAGRRHLTKQRAADSNQCRLQNHGKESPTAWEILTVMGLEGKRPGLRQAESRAPCCSSQGEQWSLHSSLCLNTQEEDQHPPVMRVGSCNLSLWLDSGSVSGSLSVLG